MIVEKYLKCFLHQLVEQEIAKITLGNSELLVQVFDNDTKISIQTTVYFGGNFIPKNVRLNLSKRPPFARDDFASTLSIDEENFRIVLNYVGGLEHLNKRMFVDLLEKFSWLGDEWRLYLDEHDKNDLIYVRSSKPLQ